MKYEFYFPKTKSKHMATPVKGKVYPSKGGTVRYGIQATMNGSMSLPKYVKEEEFNRLGFGAEEKKNCGCGQDPCKTYGAEEKFVDCDYCGRNIDLYDETNDSISCDECGKVACGSYKCNYSKNPKETWEDFTCGECVETFDAEIEGNVEYERMEERTVDVRQEIEQPFSVQTDPAEYEHEYPEDIENAIKHGIHKQLYNNPDSKLAKEGGFIENIQTDVEVVDLEDDPDSEPRELTAYGNLGKPEINDEEEYYRQAKITDIEKEFRNEDYDDEDYEMDGWVKSTATFRWVCSKCKENEPQQDSRFCKKCEKNAETFESSSNNCPICKGDIHGDMSMVGEEIVPDICGKCDVYVMPQGSDFKVSCMDCGFGDIYGSATPCEECESIEEKIKTVNNRMDAETFEEGFGWVLTSPRMGRSGVFTTKDDAEKVKAWYDRVILVPTNLEIVPANANDGELDSRSKGILLGSETVGNPSPSSPLEETPATVPSPAEPTNENFESQNSNMKLTLGLAGIGIGLAFWKGKEIMSLWDGITSRLKK